jgi:hypothetical protein
LERCLPFGAKRTAREAVDSLYSLRVGGERGKLRYFHLLYANELRMVRTMDLDEVLFALQNELEMFVVEQARRRVFLHAGVVGWGGKAIVMPGDTQTGKTTLVAALVRAGATYYSDEYAVLDPHGRVHPYPKALSIRKRDGEIDETPIEVLGGRAGSKPLTVGTVLVTRYQAGRSWRPRTLSSGRAALRLMSYTYSARFAPERTMAALLQVAERARTLAGARGDANEVAAAILEGC